MKFLSKATVAAGVFGAFTFAAVPALAVGGIPMPTAGTGGSGAHHVVASCTPVGGATSNLNQTTYAFVAVGTGFSTNGSVAIAVSMTCFVYDKATDHVWGSMSSSLPGPEAVATGTVTVPTKADAALCIKATATFSDNATASYDNCPF
jgi:hypothetical protein